MLIESEMKYLKTILLVLQNNKIESDGFLAEINDEIHAEMVLGLNILPYLTILIG